MKNLIVILLLLVNLVSGSIPYYNITHDSSNKIENQIEDVLLSETYINNTSNKQNRLKKAIISLQPFVKINPTTTYYFNFKNLKTIANTVKSGRQVLFSCFLI